MSNVMLSIYVPTYNHENYIIRALDSILMQKTQYPYEVLIGEDCSTDKTRQVLQAWEQAHADPRFHFFYREQNMHNAPINNALDLKQRCKGKYIICLEGDDFWTDPKKLEKQISFLEIHPEYYAVAHNCVVVGADDQPNGEYYQECKDIEYTLRHLANDILPGQYTTLLSRNYMTDSAIDQTLLAPGKGPGDRRVCLTILCYGRIYCMQEVMSAYRHITTAGSSFSATRRYSYDVESYYSYCCMEYARSLQNAEALKYTEYLYARCIRHALRTGKISRSRAKADIKNIQHKLRALFLLCKHDINTHLLHKNLPV